MDIEKTLKDYKKSKGKIETVEQRCQYWQYCLDTMTDEEIAEEFECEKADTYGMPRAKNNESPVERQIIMYEVKRQMVKQWIKNDQSRIRPIKQAIKQIEIALSSLTGEENYVIECKCIDNWKWSQVEIGFNEKFRKGEEITMEQLKKIKLKALKKMQEILSI